MQSSNQADARAQRSIEGAQTKTWRSVEVLLIILIALGVRLTYLYQTSSVPFVRTPVGDAAGYLDWAVRIAGGSWLEDRPFYQAPLYPYALACLISFDVDDVWIIRIVQSVGGACAASLICIAAGSWFDRRVGIVAGLMLALYPPAIFYDGLIQKTSLVGFLTCTLLALLSRGRVGRGALSLFSLGVVAALLSLTRENALIWIPILVVAVAIRTSDESIPPDDDVSRKTHSMRRVAWFALGVIVPLAPVTIFNYAQGGGLAPTTSQAGPNLYIGNHFGADGRYQPLVRGHETPEFERIDATRLAENAMGRQLSPAEVSRYWTMRTWEDIRAHPGEWVRLMGRKLLMVTNDYEVADAEGVVVYFDNAPMIGLLARVWRFGVLLPLAVMGSLLVRAQWRRYWILWALSISMAAAIALFFILGRYRYVLVPLLIPFAAVGVVRTIQLVTNRSWRELSWTLLTGVATAIVANWPVHDATRLDALARMNAGIALARSGDLVGAVPYFESAVRGHPESPEANLNLAQALAQIGESTSNASLFVRAIDHYRIAIERAPDLPGAYFNLGVALERTGDLDAARAAYEQAVAADRLDADARRALDRLNE